MKYHRILLKLSGEALMGAQNHGIDAQRLDNYAKEIKKVFDEGIEIAIVIGGGNIFRGISGSVYYRNRCSRYQHPVGCHHPHVRSDLLRRPRWLFS